MACNFSQLRRRNSFSRARMYSEEDQFYRHRIKIRARSRSIGKYEAGIGARERILKLKKLRQDAQSNYQTVHAGMQVEPRKPLKVAFTPLEKGDKAAKDDDDDVMGDDSGQLGERRFLTEKDKIEEADEEAEDEDDEEEEEGETWDSKMTFILATIGYAVGLGNIWRFPYLAQKNGGGAFVIPYTIALFTLGLPMFILELSIGQRLRKGSIGVWKQVSPYLGGLGLASGVVAFYVALYYNTIIAWCLKYLVQSFFVPLPWASCPDANDTSIPEENKHECELAGPTAYFWYRNTLDVSSDIENPESFNYIIAICLVSSWLLVYLAMIKGITESPTVVYVTAIFPYVVLIIFFVRAMTLPGMSLGIVHLFTPKFSLLLDPTTWLEAGTQIFFSLGLSFGSLIAYSSYNPVTNNCVRDAIVVAFTNCSTSIFAAIIIFAIMGFKAHTTHEKCLDDLSQITAEASEMGEGWAIWNEENITLPICNLQNELEKSASGTGLAFILFTEAVNQFPFANVWALLFFCMLFTLGLDSQFGTLQGVIQAAVDLKLFPELRKELQTGAICLACCILSMMFAHGAGNYVFTIFDNFSANIPLLIIALLQCIGVAYVYGINRFCEDIELMTGSRPHLYFCFCWKYVSPLVMISILTAFFAKMVFGELVYEAWDSSTGSTVNMEWPWWSYIVIVALIATSVIWIPLIAILRLFGVNVLSDEAPGWFPAEELREDNNVQPHKITTFERYVLGYREDNTEGVFWVTSTYSVPPRESSRKMNGSDEDKDKKAGAQNDKAEVVSETGKAKVAENGNGTLANNEKR